MKPNLAGARILAVFLCLILNTVVGYSQWTQTITPKIGTVLPVSGSSMYSDGIIWVGGEYVFMSLDSGLTWQDRTPVPKTRITDVFFYGKKDGLLTPTSLTTWIWMTSNQGQNWQQVTVTSTPHQFSAGAFVDSPYDIILIGNTSSGSGSVFHTHNGGITWYQIPFPALVYDVVVVGGGVAYVSCGVKPDGFLYETTDHGRTWRKLQGAYHPDSYQFVQDQCDPNIFYLANEDCTARNDDQSSIFVSTDKGASWQSRDQRPIVYHCGSIVASKNAVFAQTVEGVIRSTDFGETWLNIGGPSCEYDTRLVCAVSNNIILAADSNGSIWWTGNSGGFPIPEATTDDLSWDPKIPFSGDSLLLCDSMIYDTISICPTCIKQPIDLVDTRITGTDSSDYKEVALIWNDGCYSLILGFKPTTPGPSDAQYTLTLTGDRTYAIGLEGVGLAPSRSITADPSTLFTGDTVSLCDSGLTKKLFFASASECGMLKIKSVTISGFRAPEYQIVATLPDSLTGYDSLQVTFTPSGGGLRDAEIVIELEDGSIVRVPLKGVGSVPKPQITFSASDLFFRDTVCLNSTVKNGLDLEVIHCLPLRLVNQTLQGNFRADYIITRDFPDTVNGVTNLEIDFRPTAEGLRDAQLVLIFDDGSIYTIQLQGYGVLTESLSLGVTSAVATALGETVHIPFTITGLRTAEDVVFSVTYGKSLEYIGAFSPADIPFNQQIAFGGWVRLSIPRSDVVLNGPSGYLAFDAFSDSGGVHSVVFDSLSISGIQTLCRNVAKDSSVALITTPSGCGAKILSQFLRTGVLVTFTLSPNPVRSELYLVASHSVGVADIEIVNILGERMYSEKTEFAAGKRHHIPVSSFSEGVYYLRVLERGELYHSIFAVTR